ncbi:Protein BIG GRAIN 1-like A [Camellia lanceoleosa]|uniref:Protein BIG GRAIN 1-like A n=1 Tax=Camellia lanceoleosa TaxID=1840588 RepID=A0ACC0H2U7_9ERIC|nr:Protein BIG GRAIN 1-like A [Camellia lanceoleosa]
MYPPSFVSGILDEICCSMDGRNEKQRQGRSVMDENMASLCRTCLLEHEKLSPVKTSCFTTKKPNPVKTTCVSEKMGNLKKDDGFLKSKLSALKIFNNSKKEKQLIMIGVKLTSYLNSLFWHENSKKTKNSSSSSTGVYASGLIR